MECTGTNVGGIKSPPTPSEMKEYELKKGKKILVLTLSKKPFEVMVTGEKYLEFRETKNWITYGAMRSSGLETINFKFMTKLNRMQKLEYTTEPAISYSTCYVSVIFLNFFLGGIFYV